MKSTVYCSIFGEKQSVFPVVHYSQMLNHLFFSFLQAISSDVCGCDYYYNCNDMTCSMYWHYTLIKFQTVLSVWKSYKTWFLIGPKY